MSVDFGKVEKYIEDRGFGFVSHTFSKGTSQDVFFHISIIKKTYSELARAIDSTASQPIFFWYEYKTKPSGKKEVVAILNVSTMHKKHADATSKFIETINENWENIEQDISENLRKATLDLLSPDEANQLAERRKILKEEERKRQDKLREAKAARLKEIAAEMAAQREEEFAKHKLLIEQMMAKQRIEEEEFRQLVIEMSAMKFTHSNQVSRYIVRNKLGYKYKHISGILQMELNGNFWDFDGGFPRHIYARLCQELNLKNQGTDAKARKFTPYKDFFEH